MFFLYNGQLMFASAVEMQWTMQVKKGLLRINCLKSFKRCTALVMFYPKQ